MISIDFLEDDLNYFENAKTFRRLGDWFESEIHSPALAEICYARADYHDAMARGYVLEAIEHNNRVIDLKEAYGGDKD